MRGGCNSKSLSADHRCFMEFLSNRVLDRKAENNIYRTAHYQRPYCWDPPRMLKLVRDFWHCWKTDPDSSKFVGCVISCLRPERENQQFVIHDIVDGQQRVITMTLILRALVYWMRKHETPVNENDESEEGITMTDSWNQWKNWFRMSKDMHVNHAKKYHKRLRLLRADSTHWFHENVLTNDDSKIGDLLTKDLVDWQVPYVNALKITLGFLANQYGPESCRGGMGKMDSKSSIDHPLQFYVSRFHKRLATMKMQTLPDMMCFGDYIRKNVCMVHFAVADQKQAVEIFNCLNMGGLPLTSPQLLKASLFADFDHDEEVADTVDQLGEIWDEREMRMQHVLQNSTDEHLTPFLDCICEITPKDFPNIETLTAEPSNRAVFRRCHGKTVMERFTEVIIEERGFAPEESGDADPGQAAEQPLLPSFREPLFIGGDLSSPNKEAVVSFFKIYLSHELIRIFCSLIDMNDQSWGELHAESAYGRPCFLGNLGADADIIRARVQNMVTVFKHLYHMKLDENVVYPLMLFAQVWGLAEAPKCQPKQIVEFFERFEKFVAYCIICKPIGPTRNKGSAPNFWKDTKGRNPNQLKESGSLDMHGQTKDIRLRYYHELMNLIYYESVDKVNEWLELSHWEQHKFEAVLGGAEIDKLPVGSWPPVTARTTVYMLLRAELAIDDDPVQLMMSLRNVLPRSLEEFSTRHEQYRSLTLEHILPKRFRHTESPTGWASMGWSDRMVSQAHDRETLGNFTILTRKENNLAGDAEFKTKVQKVYIEGNLSRFRVTTQLLDLESYRFTPEHSHERKYRLLQYLRQAWKLPRLAAEPRLKLPLPKAKPIPPVETSRDDQRVGAKWNMPPQDSWDMSPAMAAQHAHYGERWYWQHQQQQLHQYSLWRYQQQQQRQQQQQQQQLLVLLTFRLRLHQCRNGAVSLRGAWLRRPKRLSTQQGNFYGHDVKTA